MSGKTLIAVDGSVFQQLMSGRVSFPYSPNNARDKGGDIVDVVNDENPNQEVQAKIESLEATREAGIFLITLTLVQ